MFRVSQSCGSFLWVLVVVVNIITQSNGIDKILRDISFKSKLIIYMVIWLVYIVKFSIKIFFLSISFILCKINSIQVKKLRAEHENSSQRLGVSQDQPEIKSPKT